MESSCLGHVFLYLPEQKDVKQSRSWCCWSDQCWWVFPQTICPHWGVLTVRVKAGVRSGCSICSPAFSLENSRMSGSSEMSNCISIGQARSWGAAYFCKFSHKMALLICPSACRLPRRRLSQNGCPGPGARHFSGKFSHKVALVRCPCAFRLRRLARNGCPALGPFYHDLAKVSLCALGGPADIWRFWPRSCEDPCGKMLWRSSWNPVSGPCMILYRSLLWEDVVKIWLTSSKRSLHNVAQVLIRRSYGDPNKFLSKRSLHDPVQVLVRRPWSDPL